MAKRYQLLDEVRNVVADLFTETHGRGRPSLGPDEPADHALGRSRGGFTTKVNMLCGANGTPLHFLFSGGQASDINAQPLLEDVSTLSGQRGRPRNIINSMFGLLKANRRIVTHFDKFAKSYVAMVSLACSIRCLKSLKTFVQNFVPSVFSIEMPKVARVPSGKTPSAK